MEATLGELDYEFISLEVERKLRAIFGPELVFGFIFGSVAKGYAQRSHDIDVFVCLSERMPQTERLFLAWMADLHSRYGMRVDNTYPAEIVTLSQLKSAIEQARDLKFTLGKNDSVKFDCAVWVQTIADKKAAVVDDNGVLASLESACAPLPLIWQQQVNKLVEAADPVTILRKVVKFEEQRGEPPTQPSESLSVPPKGERLNAFINALGRMRPAESGLEAYANICTVLNMLEDEIFSIEDWALPRSFATGAETARLYPPQPDNFERVPGWPGVTNMVLKREFVFVSRSGAIEIQKDNGTSESGNPYANRRETVIFAQADAAGRDVWAEDNRA